MQTSDTTTFLALIGNVYAFYRQDFSDFAGQVWLQAMRPFDLEAISESLSRHCVNPDAGQFMPKPADIVRMLQGSTQDSALAAWAKLDRAVRTVGTYRSVAFDDALIHRVVMEMGGWIEFGRKTEDEWPFVRNEFVNRYRGYRMRSETPEFPPHLIGMTEAQNAKAGFAFEAPLLLGDAAKAANVRACGSAVPLLSVTTVAQLAANSVAALPDARRQA